MNKYEQLVEFIINDETEKARELFHNIVVEKSRDIYESLVDQEDLEEVGGNQVKGLVKDVQMDEEGLAEEEEFDSEEDEDGDFDHDEFGGEEHEEASDEERITDLEDALDELKAEFDALMADEEHEPEHHDGIDDPDFSEIHGGEEEYGQEDEMEGMMYESAEEDDEEDDEEDSEELDESVIREYVDLVGKPYSGELDGSEGRTVGKGGDAPVVNAKGIVAGKNPIGAGAANARNIATGKAGQNPDGKAIPKPSNQYSKNEGDLPHAGQFKNTPGKKKVWDGSGDGGHGAEKKSGSEGKLVGNDGSRPINKKSPLKAR